METAKLDTRIDEFLQRLTDLSVEYGVDIGEHHPTGKPLVTELHPEDHPLRYAIDENNFLIRVFD